MAAASAPPNPDDISTIGAAIEVLKNWGGPLLGGSALTGIFLGGARYQAIKSQGEEHSRLIEELKEDIDDLKVAKELNAVRLAEIPTRLELQSGMARIEGLIDTRFDQLIRMIQKG